MTKAGSGPKVEGSVKKASVPKVEGSVKKASVRKSQPRPCQVRADVGGPICHQHGGKWLRKTGTGAARRDVYSCGDPGCASEVSKCPRCGNLHAANTTVILPSMCMCCAYSHFATAAEIPPPPRTFVVTCF